MKPGQLARRDYEYQRNGTAKFMIFAPLEAWRRVKVTDWRTAIDYAQALEDLSDRHFPNARSFWCRTISTPTSPHRGFSSI